ncbi:MAG: MarR family transcriptional regulator [Nitrososphaerota archaeon]|nr:MarR family transcriptional regulator [Nitrososphaerota archaeon]
MADTDLPDLFLKVWRRWRSGSPVGKGEVTQEQYWVLRTLDVSGSQRLKDLAEKLGCTPSSASTAVKRLVRSGLVTRERGKDDEREVSVRLTKEGESKLTSWRSDQLARATVLFEPLSANERRALGTLLEKVADPASSDDRRLR